MMADVVTPNKARSYAIQAGIALWISAILASITFNIFGASLSFVFLPIIVLFLWPNGADLNLTYIGLFISGLSYDLLSGAALGGWSFVFLIFYSVTLPFKSGREVGFVEAFVNYLLWLSILCLLFVIGAVLGFYNVALFSLFINALVSVFLFPLVYRFRKVLRAGLVSEDD